MALQKYIRMAKVAGVVALLVYLYIRKVPIPCFGCDTGGLFYRCMGGTGEGSRLCDAYLLGEKRVRTATGFVAGVAEDAGAFLEDLWTFTKNDLPPIIWEFIQKLKEMILTAKDEVSARIVHAIEWLRTSASKLAAKAKEGIVNTWETFKSAVIDPMVSFVLSYIVSPLVTVARALITFKNIVWNAISDAVSKFASLHLGDFVEDITKLFDHIPESIVWLKKNIVKLVNFVGVKSVHILNDGLNRSIEGVEDAVNFFGMASEKTAALFVSGLNGLKNSMVSGINNTAKALGGAATSLINHHLDEINATFKIVNQGLEYVEEGVNIATRKISSVLTKNIEATNSVLGVLDDIENFRFLNREWFDWLNVPERVDHVDIPTLTGLEIPEITKVSLGNVDGVKAPPDISKPEVNEISLPKDVVPPIPKVTVEDLDNVVENVLDAIPEGALSALTWIPSKISHLKDSIASIFENFMEPVYAAVTTILASIFSLWNAIVEFFSKYLTLTAIRERIVMLYSLGRKLIVEDLIQNIILNELIPGFIDIMVSLKEPILDFVQNAAARLWDFLGRVGNGAAKLFTEVYRVVVKITTLVAKNVFAVWYYSYGNIIDKITFFIPLNVSLKIVLITVLLIAIIFGGIFMRVKSVLKFAASPAAGMIGPGREGHALTVKDIKAFQKVKRR